MIINTGLRTDIPAFYTPWLLNRLREGFVLVRSPYAPATLTRYRLDPAVVDLIAFCTKNPGPMLPHLGELRRYAGQYWFVTITPYGREIEPRVPEKRRGVADFRALSRAIGVDSVGWRYDPILLNETYTVERHLADFEALAAALEGYTKTCVISFLDLYQKVRRNFPEARAVEKADRLRLGAAMAKIAAAHGMTLKACAEGQELAPYGIDCGGCMTIATYEQALHARLAAPRRPAARDGACACHPRGRYWRVQQLPAPVPLLLCERRPRRRRRQRPPARPGLPAAARPPRTRRHDPRSQTGKLARWADAV